MLYTELRAFHAVAEQGGFTRAAERLEVSQPTVSEQVKALESRYQVRLFERRGRRVELTDIGRSLLGATARLFLAEVQARQILAAARDLSYGRLRIGADSPYLVVPLIAGLRRRYPGIEVSLSLGNTASLREELLARTVDVAVVAEVGADPRLHAVALRHDRIVAIVPRGHPLATRRSIELDELAGASLVLREPGSRTRAVLEDALAGVGLVPVQTLEIGSREAIREAVAAGLGVGVVAESELGADGRLVPVPIAHADLGVVEYVACIAERRPVRAIAALFDLVQPGSAAAD